MSREYPTLNTVVEQVQERNLMTDDAAAAIATVTFSAETESVPTPWYVRALVGVSAWVASFFLIGFLAVAEIVTDETRAIVVGLILLGASLVLKRLMDQSLFIEQLAFALSLAGQGIFVGGIGVMYESITFGALAAIGVEALLFLLYPDSLHRLISLFIAGLALLFLIIDQELPERTSPSLYDWIGDWICSALAVRIQNLSKPGENFLCPHGIWSTASPFLYLDSRSNNGIGNNTVVGDCCWVSVCSPLSWLAHFA